MLRSARLGWLALIWLLLLQERGFAVSFDHSHKAWSDLLRVYVNDKHLVDYQAWRANTTSLESYLEQLQTVAYQDYLNWNPLQQKAFLINAYNAFTIKLILDHYPVASIRKIGGFFTSPWKLEFFKLLDGKIKSLDPIEHNWLRQHAQLKDARIHAAVNCASISCPVLQRSAFVATQLDKQLDQANQQWLADPSRNRFDLAAKTVYLSKIFDWYEEDFGDNKAGVLAFLKKFGPKSLQSWQAKDVSIEYLDYNWSLNDSSPPSQP